MTWVTPSPQPTLLHFAITEDRTAELQGSVEFRNTRLNRFMGTVSVDVRLRNTTAANLGGPIRIHFTDLVDKGLNLYSSEGQPLSRFRGCGSD